MLSLAPLLDASEISKMINANFRHGLRRRLAALTDIALRLYSVNIRFRTLPSVVQWPFRMFPTKGNRKKREDSLSGSLSCRRHEQPTLYYAQFRRQVGPLRCQHFAYGLRQVIRCTCHVVHADELAVRCDDSRGRFRA